MDKIEQQNYYSHHLSLNSKLPSRVLGWLSVFFNLWPMWSLEVSWMGFSGFLNSLKLYPEFYINILLGLISEMILNIFLTS